MPLSTGDWMADVILGMTWILVAVLSVAVVKFYLDNRNPKH